MTENRTIEIVKEEQCFGCGACYNKCPVDAISMEYNQEGFLSTIVDKTKCVNCGLCRKACPALNVKYINSSSPECYAVMAEDKVREVSSSGGAFTLIADYILDNRGVVCGAAFSDDWYSVEHIIIRSKDELFKLRGSKYVQSDTKNVYTELESYLKKGTIVLFTGCPCQVAGLYAFLGKDYPNLYTADLVCHGVPSEKAYKLFLDEKKSDNTEIAYVSMRDKVQCGWNVSTTIKYINGKVDFENRSKSAWMKSFLGLISLRKSCGKCPFAKIPRQGDVTLADFWDIGKYKKDLDDGLGTSCVLINNEKGRDLIFKHIASKCKIIEETPLEYAKKHNAQIYASSLLNPRRERFFKLLDKYIFSKAVDYGMNRKFDIGYIGWWYGKNYGSALTSFAMHETLEQMGKTVLMIDWPEHIKPTSPPPNSKVRQFAKKHYDISMRYTYEELPKLNYYCDAFLVGSDQLWNYYSVEENGYYFFLDFVEKEKRKIAYATSFGHEYSFFPENQNFKICELLNQFNAISVREKEGVDICYNSFGVKAVQVIDPVFLCGLEAYNKVIKDVSIDLSRPYLLAYILDPDESKRKLLLDVAGKLALELRVILDGQGDFDDNKAKLNLDDKVLLNIGVEEWLAYFKNASYIVTDSYHGLCFSILFNKEFICIENYKRGLSRFYNILDITGLENRMINIESNKDKADILLYQRIDYTHVNKALIKEIEKSRMWLKNALDAPNIKQPSINALLCNKLYELEEQIKLIEDQNNKSKGPKYSKKGKELYFKFKKYLNIHLFKFLL